MKRYLIFLFPHFFPYGGCGDLYRQANTFKECIKILRDIQPENSEEHAHILDIQTGDLWQFSMRAGFEQPAEIPLPHIDNLTCTDEEFERIMRDLLAAHKLLLKSLLTT